MIGFNEIEVDNYLAPINRLSLVPMGAKYIKIFTNELVTLETSDGIILSGIIQSSKNDFDHIENYSPEIQGLHEIVITVKQKGNNRWDFPIKIKDFQSIERVE
ncbi:hypothetical protein J0X14_07580 [Muricauda sp. CAU 1633]|uniref:hypothetical protein n=1 Tax=Allomuricauda sp. CAU 1633 TaxID=2816036 RepID=UPI001A8FD121|nr:hypothetical protein [Muricauda sp. CAU 1633]MBO0322151.1 hypothetical protein [Muricauda sp. CAU 1633]